jgi:hypothetical protein
MFDTLDETMKHDDQAASSLASRLVPWVVGILATVVVLSGIVYLARMIG